MTDKQYRARIRIALVLAGVLMVSFILGAFLVDREKSRQEGHAHGFTTGYSMGYADRLGGRKQESQKLAGRIVPYETGTAWWKYFIMGFAEGYDVAQLEEDVWLINES